MLLFFFNINWLDTFRTDHVYSHLRQELIQVKQQITTSVSDKVSACNSQIVAEKQEYQTKLLKVNQEIDKLTERLSVNLTCDKTINNSNNNNNGCAIITLSNGSNQEETVSVVSTSNQASDQRSVSVKACENVCGVRFSTLEDLPASVTRSVRQLKCSRDLTGITDLPKHWDAVIRQKGDYTEGL